MLEIGDDHVPGTLDHLVDLVRPLVSVRELVSHLETLEVGLQLLKVSEGETLAEVEVVILAQDAMNVGVLGVGSALVGEVELFGGRLVGHVRVEGQETTRLLPAIRTNTCERPDPNLIKTSIKYS